MASESAKKNEGIKKSTTKATTSKKATTKTVTAKKQTTKKTTSKSSEPKKTASKKKTTKTEPKKTVSATKSTASTTVKKSTKTSTKKSQVATPEKKESKKNVVEKKVVVKEPVKKIKEKEEKLSVEHPAASKVERSTTKQEIKEPQEHFGIYLFLLSTILICLHVMSRFNFIINDIKLDYSVVLFSSVYFVSNIITKKFDFKKSILAIAVSAVAMLLFVYFSRYLNTKVVDYFVIYGNTFAYIISQLLNLIIYYYLLVNTELKSRWVYLTYLFSLAAYYFISILFSTRIIITDSFWPTFFCSFILSGIIAIMYAFYDSLIRRGHE